MRRLITLPHPAHTFPLMSYFEQSDMTGLVPEDWLTDGLTDGDTSAFAAVHASVKADIDGAIGSRFPLPLNTGNAALAAQLKSIGVTLAVEALYTRRQIPIDEKSTLFARISRAWKVLDTLRDGTHPLVPSISRGNDSIAVIGEDSRVYSEQVAA